MMGMDLTIEERNQKVIATILILYKAKKEQLCECICMLREITENKPAEIENW